MKISKKAHDYLKDEATTGLRFSLNALQQYITSEGYDEHTCQTKSRLIEILNSNIEMFQEINRLLENMEVR